MDLYYVLGVVSVVLLSALLAVLVLRWPLGAHKTFSQHAAQNRWLSVYYFVIFAVTLPLFAAYLNGSIISTYGLPGVVLYVFIGAVIFQLLCTLFPEKAPNVVIHRTLAGVSAGLLLVVMMIVCYWCRGTSAGVVSLVGLVVMMVAIVSAILLKQRYAMVLQIIYYGGFFIPLLMI